MVTICIPYMAIVTIPIPNLYMIHILNKIYNPGKSTGNVVLGRNGRGLYEWQLYVNQDALTKNAEVIKLNTSDTLVDAWDIP